MDERGYPASEIRGGGQECQAATDQEQPGGATRGPRPGAGGWEELTQVQGPVAAQAQEG